MPAFLWAPFVAVIVAAIVVFFTVSDNAAWLVSYGGTVLVLIGLTVYALIDSKSAGPVFQQASVLVESLPSTEGRASTKQAGASMTSALAPFRALFNLY